MLSSIFNSICLATALLASSTSAQSQLGSWALKYQNTTTNFIEGATDDITLTYLIGKSRDWNITLFAPDCASDISITIPNPYDDQANLVTRTNNGGDEDLLEISLNLDKTDITSSNIWVNSALKFCVSLQLWSGGTVVKEDLRIIDITFDYDVDFEAVSGVGLTGPSLTSPATGGDEAKVDSYVSACQCVIGYACDPAPLGVDDTLKVCIKSSNASVLELKSLTNLTLLQGTTGEELLVIKDNIAVDPQVAWISASNAVDFVESVVPTRFFRTTLDASLTVLGQVEVMFKGSRRLVSFEYGNNPTSTAATRDMRGGETVSRPGFSRLKQGSANEESTDRQVSESSNFGFTVGLVAMEDDNADALNEMFPENSGTYVKEATHFLWVVAFFAWAYVW